MIVSHTCFCGKKYRTRRLDNHEGRGGDVIKQTGKEPSVQFFMATNGMITGKLENWKTAY
jgi:hypothetical protein